MNIFLDMTFLFI